MAKLYGFEIVIDSSVPVGKILFSKNEELHLNLKDWNILRAGSFDKRSEQLHLKIANSYGEFIKYGKNKKEIELPNIEIIDSEKDYTYLEVCESCSDSKKCKRVPISNTITFSYNSEQLFIDKEQLEEKTKFVCQYCFNYLKQTGVFE